MAQDWFELKASDRVDLDDVTQKISTNFVNGVQSFGDSISQELFELLQDEFEINVDDKTLQSEIKLIISNNIEYCLKGLLTFGAKEFVDEVGSRGWEILPPRKAAFVSGLLEEVFRHKSQPQLT